VFGLADMPLMRKDLRPEIRWLACYIAAKGIAK